MNNPDFEAVKIPRRNLLQPRSKENGHPSAKGETALSLSLLFRGSHHNRQKACFHKSRTGAVGNINSMPEFKERFMKDLIAHATSSDPETAAILENKLTQIWEEFHEEYERVSIDDLDRRCSRFVTIEEAQ